MRTSDGLPTATPTETTIRLFVCLSAEPCHVGMCRDPKVGPPIFWDAEWYLILNTAVGGGWPGLPSSATVFPAYHQIDYVRVSQRAVTATQENG